MTAPIKLECLYLVGPVKCLRVKPEAYPKGREPEMGPT
jgi:hypothetical protein